MRRPLTGTLSLKIHAVKDVDHAASSRFSRGPETYIIVKVEDTVKIRTKTTRSDKWQDEVFNVAIDKANELELDVYDKSGDRSTPIGMLWIRISDIAEEMRRKKMETEFNASGWVSADKMAGQEPGSHASSGSGHSHHSGGGSRGSQSGSTSTNPNASNAYSGGPVVIDAWYALEPVGRVHMTMSFSRTFFSPCFLRYTTNVFFSEGHGPLPQGEWSHSPGCGSSEEGGDCCETRTQIRLSTILQHYALCTLRRLLKVCCRYAVCRLQVHLP